MAFNLSRAICRRNVFESLAGIRSSPLLNARCVTLKAAPVAPPSKENFDEKNLRLKRPQSPHLTIYQFQLTSVLSITHRFTGLALAGYATVLGLGALASPYDFAHYMTMLEGLQLSAPTLVALKFVLAYPATYHTVNGVRHLFWDLGKFLTIKEVYSTGYAMLIGSAILAGVLSVL